MSLREKYKIIFNQREKFINEHHVYNQKSSFIGCKHCGSRINKKYFLKTDICPACKKDMRGKWILDKIKEYDDKLEALKIQIQNR